MASLMDYRAPSHARRQRSSKAILELENGITYVNAPTIGAEALPSAASSRPATGTGGMGILRLLLGDQSLLRGFFGEAAARSDRRRRLNVLPAPPPSHDRGARIRSPSQQDDDGDAGHRSDRVRRGSRIVSDHPREWRVAAQRHIARGAAGRGGSLAAGGAGGRGRVRRVTRPT